MAVETIPFKNKIIFLWKSCLREIVYFVWCKTADLVSLYFTIRWPTLIKQEYEEETRAGRRPEF